MLFPTPWPGFTVRVPTLAKDLNHALGSHETLQTFPTRRRACTSARTRLAAPPVIPQRVCGSAEDCAIADGFACPYACNQGDDLYLSFRRAMVGASCSPASSLCRSGATLHRPHWQDVRSRAPWERQRRVLCCCGDAITVVTRRWVRLSNDEGRWWDGGKKREFKYFSKEAVLYMSNFGKFRPTTDLVLILCDYDSRINSTTVLPKHRQFAPSHGQQSPIAFSNGSSIHARQARESRPLPRLPIPGEL